MDRSEQVTLIKETFTQDAIGNHVATETQRTVFCNISSVSRTEWYEAGRNGLNASLVVTVYDPEYEGEKIASIDNHRYAIYRTYRKKDETIELYLEDKAGV